MKRVFRVNNISPDKTKVLDFNAPADAELIYEGKKITTKI